MHISSTLAEKGLPANSITATQPTGHRCTHIYELSSMENINGVTHSSELSVRNYVAPVIESKRDGAEVFPLEDMLSKEQH